MDIELDIQVAIFFALHLEETVQNKMRNEELGQVLKIPRVVRRNSWDLMPQKLGQHTYAGSWVCHRDLGQGP